MRKKLTDAEVEALLKEYAAGTGGYHLGRKYGVSPKCVQHWVTGDRRPDIRRPWKFGEAPTNGTGPNAKNRKRLATIKTMRAAGRTYEEIAKKVGISSSYARQLVQRHAPEVK